MKQAILLYNAFAGHRMIVSQLDKIVDDLQQLGYELKVHRSTAPGDIEAYTKSYINEENTDLILVSGGDGTVNECISAMCRKEIDIPLMILPLGTANDFATAAGIPAKVDDCMELIEKGRLSYIDIGQVNDRYFINVCNMGLFSGVSHTVDPELKKKFGRLAYYFKGLEEMQNFEAMDITLTVDGEVLHDQYLLILVFNGKGAGGLLNLAKHAEISDGEFDIVCIKNMNLFDMPVLMFKVLQGEHLKDTNVDYLTGRHITIECHNQDKKHFVTDVDGETGPDLPMAIKVLPNKIRVYLPQNSTQA